MDYPRRIRGSRSKMTPGSVHWEQATYSKKYRRRPRTTQERRRYLGDQADQPIFKIRPKRSYPNLPSAWSYKNHRSDIEDRSWKDLTRRRHQYEIKIWKLDLPTTK